MKLILDEKPFNIFLHFKFRLLQFVALIFAE